MSVRNMPINFLLFRTYWGTTSFDFAAVLLLAVVTWTVIDTVALCPWLIRTNRTARTSNFACAVLVLLPDSTQYIPITFPIFESWTYPW